MLPSYMIVAIHPRCSPRSGNVQACLCSDVLTLLPLKSFPLNSFADPHPVNPVASILYENTGEGGAVSFDVRLSTFNCQRFYPLLTAHFLLSPSASSHPKPLLSRPHFVLISPLDATLMGLPASVANKRLTAWLSPLDATLIKNRGRGNSYC